MSACLLFLAGCSAIVSCGRSPVTRPASLTEMAKSGLVRVYIDSERALGGWATPLTRGMSQCVKRLCQEPKRKVTSTVRAARFGVIVTVIPPRRLRSCPSRNSYGWSSL